MLILSSFILLETFAQNLIKGIQENIRSKQVTPFGAMHSTGQAENSLFYRIDANRLIIGSTWAYITVLEDGRKPGKFAPPEVIEKWIEHKPIISDLSKKSLAFLINRSMKEKGSLLWRQGGNSGVLSDYINQDYIHKYLTEPMTKALVGEISSKLFKPAVA
jgi:hypothetical protein